MSLTCPIAILGSVRAFLETCVHRVCPTYRGAQLPQGLLPVQRKPSWYLPTRELPERGAAREEPPPWSPWLRPHQILPGSPLFRKELNQLPSVPSCEVEEVDLRLPEVGWCLDQLHLSLLGNFDIMSFVAFAQKFWRRQSAGGAWKSVIPKTSAGLGIWESPDDVPSGIASLSLLPAKSGKLPPEYGVVSNTSKRNTRHRG